MNKPLFKMLLMKGAKGDNGVTEEVPRDSAIPYLGDNVPEGYTLLSDPPSHPKWIVKTSNALTANAHVVDSLDETTNDHINAPSIHAVREALDVSWDTVYPIGSIYLTTANVDPSTLFGGTWVQIKDRFLLADGDTYHAGATGGSATHTPSGTVGNHTLTVNEIPFHEHGYDAFYPSVVSGYTPHKINTGNYDSYSDGKAKTDNMFDENGVLVENDGQPHNHPFTGTATNTMPPYLVVYVWVRTA